MSDLVDRQDFIERQRELYCNDCDRRKGVKNGKPSFVYEIGGVPCRACSLDDVLGDLEDAPPVDAVPVVRCEKCRYRLKEEVVVDGIVGITCDLDGATRTKDFFCSFGDKGEPEHGNP